MKHARQSFLAIILLAAGSSCQIDSSKSSDEAQLPEIQSAAVESGEVEVATEVYLLGGIQDIKLWMTNFHKEPDPDRMVLALHLASEYGLWEIHGDLVIAFFAETFRLYPNRVAGWMEEVHDIPSMHRRWICKSIWWSQIPGWENVLESFNNYAVKDFRDELSSYLASTPAVLLEARITPHNLDCFWGSYFANGNFEYVDKIVTAYSSLHEQKEGGVNLLMYGAAKWSLASHAAQHSDIRNYLEDKIEEAVGLEREGLTAILVGIPRHLEGE